MSVAAVRAWWKDITPQRRRTIMLLGILVVVFVLANVFKRERPVVKKREKEAEMSVVTPPRKEEGLGDLRTRVEGLSANLEAERARAAQLEKRLLALSEGNRENDNRATAEVMKEVGQLRQDVTLLRNGAFDPKAAPTDKALNDLPPPIEQPKPVEAPRPRVKVSGEAPTSEVAQPTEINVAGNKITLTKADPTPAAAKPAGAGIVTNTANAAAAGNVAAKGEAASAATLQKGMQFIPAGTIIQGVTLNGVDAPTSGTAQRNTVPIVMRIKKEAILPSRATQDLRECFIIMAVYGVMSSERIKGRTETISCVRADGGVVESKIDGFVVDTDGREGIKGTLVSKQGAVIARGLLAGFVSGFGALATPTMGSSLMLNSTSQPMLSPDLGAAAGAGAIRGVSQAANDIAKFFLDTAKEMHPVIEVPSGIDVTVILVRGVSLSIGSGNLQRKEAWQTWFQ